MPARILNGKVIRKIDTKTLVVDVVYSTRHPLYVKVLKKHKKLTTSLHLSRESFWA